MQKYSRIVAYMSNYCGTCENDFPGVHCLLQPGPSPNLTRKE